MSTRGFLRKWDLEKHARVARFRYTKPFHRMDADEFLRDFFESEVVNEHFEVLDRAKRWRSVREIAAMACGETVENARDDASVNDDEVDLKTKTPKPSVMPRLRIKRVCHEKTPCALTSMSVFDALKLETADPQITRANTDVLMRRADDIVDGFPVADELRAFLLGDESHEEKNLSGECRLLAETEKDEFLFRIFSHCVLGGSTCQYEETLRPYETVAKDVYKSLVRAKKNETETGGAVVVTDVYSVSAVVVPSRGNETDEKEKEMPLFPKPGNRQNFCYVCVDPWRRHVTVWYHGFVPYW